MPQDLYYGEYVKFYVEDRESVADFMGADNLVGDAFSIDIRDEQQEYKAYLINRFGNVAGYLDKRCIRRLQIAQAKGWETAAFLSFIAFTQGHGADDPGSYWGEVAILAYDRKLDGAMAPFRDKLTKAMADGARPQVDFGKKSVDLLMGGNWFPTDKAPRPKMGKGSEILKDHRTPNERLIEQSRKGNVGCYIASFAFIIAIIAIVLFAFHSCGVI